MAGEFLRLEYYRVSPTETRTIVVNESTASTVEYVISDGRLANISDDCGCGGSSEYQTSGTEPERVNGIVEYDPKFNVDHLASGMLDFGQGTSTFTCSTQLESHQRVNIIGTKGRIEIEIPFNAPPDKPCKMWHQQGDKTEEILFEICDQYTIQGDLFSLAVLNDTEVPTPLEDAVANMKVIEAIIQSAESGAWV